MTKKLFSLPQELNRFDSLLKNCLKNSSSSGSCLTIMRCIPGADVKTWEKIQSQEVSKDWFAVKLDLKNINNHSIFDTVCQKTQECTPKKEEASHISPSQCLVGANEKHFLFFGSEL